jgi:hypothetical protein
LGLSGWSGRTARLTLGPRLIGVPASELKEAPALDVGVEHFQSSAAGVDLVVMREIGEAFEDAEQLLVPRAAPDRYIAGADCELNGPVPPTRCTRTT